MKVISFKSPWRLILIVSLLSMLLVPATLRADTVIKYWIGGSGDWSTPANWGGTVPQAGEMAMIQQQDPAATATMAITYSGSLYGPGSGLVRTVIGNSSTGTTLAAVLQQGGTMHAGDLILGRYGSYMLQSGSLFAGSTRIGGPSGTSSFFQQGLEGNSASGGAFQTDSLSMGWTSPPPPDPGASGSGTYWLAYGSLTVANDAWIGNGGYGGFNQGLASAQGGSRYWAGNGGSVLIGNLHLGTTHSVTSGGTTTSTAGNGVYTMLSGGSRDSATGTITPGLRVTGSARIGESASGTFNQGFARPNQTTTLTGDGGFVQIDGSLTLGANQGASGTYNLSVGTLTVAGDTFIGSRGTGSFNQGVYWGNNGAQAFSNGGEFNASGNLYLGYYGGGTGSYNLHNGSLHVTGDLFVGYEGSGNFNQGDSYSNSSGQPVNTGGIVTARNLYVGGAASGYYYLYGGSLSTTQDAYIGRGGQGTFTQGNQNGTPGVGGGTFTTRNLYLGGAPGVTFGNGTYNLYSGSFTATEDTFVGYANRGQITQGMQSNFPVTGGTFETRNLYLGYASGSNGSYNLYNGTLTATGDTFVGYQGWGQFVQGNPSGNSPAGSTFRTRNLYVGGGPGASSGTGNYYLYWGSFTATEDTYVGYGGNGTVGQGTQNFMPPDSITFTTRNLYLGGGTTFGNGAYYLVNGILTVTANTYLGHETGQGVFNQGAPVYYDPYGNFVFGPGGTHRTMGDLYAGNTGGRGTYNLYQGTLDVRGNTYVGYTGTGTFKQGMPVYNQQWGFQTSSGGTHTTSNLYLGAVSGTGTYQLYRGELTVSGNTYVGYASTGSFSQGTPVFGPDGALFRPSGGTHTTSNLYLGGAPGGSWCSGTYDLYQGALNVSGNSYIGYTGMGTFNQGTPVYDNTWGSWSSSNGGTHRATNLFLGGGPGSPSGTGIYNFYAGGNSFSAQAGLLVTGNAYVGYNGTGTFNQGYHAGSQLTFDTFAQINGSLYVGGSPDGTSGTGIYDLHNGGLAVSGNTYVGYSGTGTFTQGRSSGPGTGNLDTENLFVGSPEATGGTGSYNLLNGTLNVRGTTYVGRSGQGTFTQGGSMVPTGGGTHRTTGLYVGGAPGSSGNGTYYLNSGTLSNTGDTYVGHSGTGTFTQGQSMPGMPGMPGMGGGTFTSRDVYVGAGSGASGTGTYNLNSGSLTARNTYIGSSLSLGTFNQSGGNHQADYVRIGPGSGATGGTYNLYGGTVTAAIINQGAFNWQGGDFRGALQNWGTVAVTNWGSRTFTGDVTNNAGGRISVTDANVTFQGTVQNAGTTTVTGSSATFQNSLENTGTTTVNGGSATFTGTVTNNAGGVMSFSNSSATFNNQVINNAGGTFSFTNTTATFALPVINYGVWTSDPSTLTFSGDFTIAPGGSLIASDDIYTIYGNFTDSGSLSVEGGSVTFNLYGAGIVETLAISAGSTLYLNGTGSLLISEIMGLVFGPGGTITNISGPSGFRFFYNPSSSGLTGVYTLSGGGTLAPMSSTPIPGAVWLLAPALLALIGLRRRVTR